MPTAQFVIKWINAGAKDGKPWFNMKDENNTTYWSRSPIMGVSQGDLVTVDYTVGKSGGFNLVKYGIAGEAPARGNGGLRTAPGKPGAMGGEKDRLIAALALLKPMLESGKIPSHEEAKEMCDRALSMYEYMRVSYNPQHADDMNDEVPL